MYKEVNGSYPSEALIGTHLGYLDGIESGVNDPDTLLKPYLSGPLRDPLHDGVTYFYYFDAFFFLRTFLFWDPFTLLFIPLARAK